MVNSRHRRPATRSSPGPSPDAPAPPMPPYDPTFTFLPPPPSVLPAADVPFLDTPWVPPQTRRQGWMWLFYAVIGFLWARSGR